MVSFKEFIPMQNFASSFFTFRNLTELTKSFNVTHADSCEALDEFIPNISDRLGMRIFLISLLLIIAIAEAITMIEV